MDTSGEAFSLLCRPVTRLKNLLVFELAVLAGDRVDKLDVVSLLCMLPMLGVGLAARPFSVDVVLAEEMVSSVRSPLLVDSRLVVGRGGCEAWLGAVCLDSSLLLLCRCIGKLRRVPALRGAGFTFRLGAVSVAIEVSGGLGTSCELVVSICMRMK